MFFLRHPRLKCFLLHFVRQRQLSARELASKPWTGQIERPGTAMVV